MSMLAAVARAAGLDTEAEAPMKPPTPQDPAAVAAVLAAARRPVKRPAPTVKAAVHVYETAEATAYLAHLQAHGHKIETRERNAILSYGMTWATSPEVRREFSSFAVFAAYSRAKARNAVKILGQ